MALVSVPLAGCLGSDGGETGATGDIPAPDPLTLAFDAPALVAPGGDIETSITARGDIVLVCSHGGFWQASPVWASQDGGMTWERLAIGPNPIVSGDCDVEIMDDGSWVVVFDTIASATIAVSHDDGTTWRLNYASALPVGVDRPWLASHGDALYMIYADVMAVAPGLGLFAVSTDHGRTWTQNTYAVFEDLDTFNHVHGDILAGPQGTLWIPVARDNKNIGGPGLFYDVYRSSDGGSSWQRLSVEGPIDTRLALPFVTLDGNGTLWMPITTRNDSAYDILLARSHDDGATWQVSQAVTTHATLPGVVGPSISGRPDGGIVLAWLNQTDDGWTVRALTAELRGEQVAAGPSVLVHPAGERRQQYEFLMVTHDDAGRALIAYVTDDGDCDPAPNPVESRGSQCVYVARQVTG